MKLVKIKWILLVFCASLLCVHGLGYIKNVFQNPNVNESFIHMKRYTRTGSIYIGAINKIFKIGPNLVQEQFVSTGPRQDNPKCLPNQVFACQEEMKSMPSYNKALVIDESSNQLIACSSLFHGFCEKRKLDDISEKEPEKFTPVVANNKTASTVAFIAPGPSETIPQPNVLYVGAQMTNTGLPAARDLVPAFSSRNLNTFQIFKKGIVTSSSKAIEAQQKQSFPIYYKYGFSSDGFSYITTIQKASTSSEEYISKLIRVCQGDEHFYSYTEVQLKCLYNGNEYKLIQAAHIGKPGTGLAQTLGIPITEDVLFGVFALGRPNSVEALNNSALCLFPMRKVRQVFTRNIRRCFEGIGNTGPDHFVTPSECLKSDLIDQIDDNYCGTQEFNQPINGAIPIQETAAVTLNVSASSIIVSTTHKYTVAFVGTTSGHIMKIAVESQHVAKTYEDVTIEQNSPVLSDMAFDSDSEHLYVMTKKAIYKMAVQDCSQYTTCATCRGAKDPYCGWCSLEDKCSLREDCSEHDSDLRWLEYSGQTCTNITQVYPDKIQKDKALKTTTLTLNISNLPSYSGQYKCAFDGYKVHEETPANRTGPNVITCETPLPNKLPPFPTGADHIVMRLSVLMNNKDFVSTNFTFFDCEVHTKESCYRCTLSRFNCTWCVNNHMCTHYPLGECSSDDTFLAGSNSQGLSLPHRKGPQFCPRIESSSKDWILIPSGTSKEIPLTGHNLLPFQKPLYCFFSLKRGIIVRARRISHTSSVDLIDCSSVDFSYLEEIKFQNVPFKIVWGSETSNKFLDNPGNIQVKLFKCEMMATTCGECLTLDSGYGCGWCGKKCSIQRHCSGHDWLPQAVTCPNPQITSIRPLLGPKKGGTLLTIEGQNLGKKFEDIVSNVDVVGIQCIPLRDEYVAASKIVCRTGELIGGGGASGPIRVTVESKYVASSSESFSYVDPIITDISPKRGPQSGGTRVTLTGEYLNAGTSLTASVGGLPCRIDSSTVTATTAMCTTESSNTTSSGYVNLVFDNQQVATGLQYLYVPDPYITNVNPKKAIFSGGIKLTVTGQYLDTIQNPKMILWNGNEAREGECQSNSSKTLVCHSPQVSYKLPQGTVNTGVGIPYPYGFRMDAVKDLLNLSKLDPSVFKNFTLYPDPKFDLFPGDIKSHTRKNDKILIISGQFIGLGFEESDVKVKVGRSFCNVTAAVKQLTCLLPEKQPSSVRGNKYPEVEIDVGINFTTFLGYLKYEESDLPIPLEYIILIAVGGGVLIISIVIVIIMYYVKSKKNDSLMKNLQIQMDNLEAKVAKECKEAFAELQTDITELNNDLYGQVAIPFWDYRTYCMRVLFPQELDTDHPVIRDLEVDYSKRDTVEKGLKLFAQLMNNKTFLLIFVRTLEGHKQFTMRDRVNVASLISVALQTKMEYATDILKTLLAELIEKSVEGKNHPKLLLRRTESVAEKMLTNWFTFLLYKFLRECAGEPLFMLYTAVKQQVSKGPVDAVTGEARYSLSEDKLIRQQMEFRQMTIFVQDMEQFGQQPHPVKVLDCDTISQVKEKILDAIYKNAPFSSRPGRDDVDLVLFDQSTPEWNSGIKGRLILQDDDNTSKQEGDYKRTNTLAHYKVPDSAYMTLVPKQPPSIYNLSLSSSEKSSGSKLYGKFYENLSYTRSPSLNRTLSPQGVHIEIENGGIKHYHLVKQHDSETHKEGDRGSKMVSEIYLTRLLATKGTLQQFVDDMFERIFSTAHRGTVLPLAIKYMFDFLDDQALLHNIQDSEVVHTWKSNSLPLRFWVNVIKNPNFVFDIYKSNIVDSCLSVVAQTFMDSCSMSEHRLGKDSPSSKLLYAKDIPKYKKWVERYYQDIKMMPAISDQDMTAMMTEESRSHSDEFNVNAALLELYKYVQRYNDELWHALEEDEFARKNKLTYKLEQVRMAMEKEVYI